VSGKHQKQENDMGVRKNYQLYFLMAMCLKNSLPKEKE
jgi:hypothetical protein